VGSGGPTGRRALSDVDREQATGLPRREPAIGATIKGRWAVDGVGGVRSYRLPSAQLASTRRCGASPRPRPLRESLWRRKATRPHARRLLVGWLWAGCAAADDVSRGAESRVERIGVLALIAARAVAAHQGDRLCLRDAGGCSRPRPRFGWRTFRSERVGLRSCRCGAASTIPAVDVECHRGRPPRPARAYASRRDGARPPSSSGDLSRARRPHPLPASAPETLGRWSRRAPTRAGGRSSRLDARRRLRADNEGSTLRAEAAYARSWSWSWSIPRTTCTRALGRACWPADPGGRPSCPIISSERPACGAGRRTARRSRADGAEAARACGAIAALPDDQGRTEPRDDPTAGSRPRRTRPARSISAPSASACGGSRGASSTRCRETRAPPAPARRRARATRRCRRSGGERGRPPCSRGGTERGIPLVDLTVALALRDRRHSRWRRRTTGQRRACETMAQHPSVGAPALAQNQPERPATGQTPSHGSGTPIALPRERRALGLPEGARLLPQGVVPTRILEGGQVRIPSASRPRSSTRSAASALALATFSRSRRSRARAWSDRRFAASRSRDAIVIASGYCRRRGRLAALRASGSCFTLASRRRDRDPPGGSLRCDRGLLAGLSFSCPRSLRARSSAPHRATRSSFASFATNVALLRFASYADHRLRERRRQRRHQLQGRRSARHAPGRAPDSEPSSSRRFRTARSVAARVAGRVAGRRSPRRAGSALGRTSRFGRCCIRGSAPWPSSTPPGSC
jgi:hypothetical protein